MTTDEAIAEVIETFAQHRPDWTREEIEKMAEAGRSNISENPDLFIKAFREGIIMSKGRSCC